MLHFLREFLQDPDRKREIIQVGSLFFYINPSLTSIQLELQKDLYSLWGNPDTMRQEMRDIIRAETIKAGNEALIK
jgi:hypothetical protein